MYLIFFFLLFKGFFSCYCYWFPEKIPYLCFLNDDFVFWDSELKNMVAVILKDFSFCFIKNLYSSNSYLLRIGLQKI